MKKNYFVLLFAIVTILSSSKVFSQDGMMGEIKMFGGNFAPRGWAFCDGQLLAISTNSALFSLLGTNYGGDGRTTFGLPDMRGRAAIGVGQGPGLSNYIDGDKGGSETEALTVSQMPSHSHTITNIESNQNVLLSEDEGVRSVPVAGDVPAAAKFGNGLGATPVKSYGPPTNTVNGQSITSTIQALPNGSNMPVDIRQPYMAVRYIICTIGIYPPRN